MHAVLAVCRELFKSLLSINLCSLHKNSWGRYFYHPIYWWENCGPERLSCPRSHSWWIACVEIKPKQPRSRIGVSYSQPLACLIVLSPARILHIIPIKQINRRFKKGMQLAQGHIGRVGTWIKIWLTAKSVTSTTRP